MDDKTMLEMAAKTCGAYWFGHYGCWYMGDNPWRPLTNDGDALRLAVKLRLDIEFLRGGDFVKVSTYYGDVSAEVEHTGEPAADTRRAIVRAAAEIGKGMGVGE